MKYIFWGTPRFAEIILETLIRADMVPAAVVCNPNRPVGRKKILTSPPTKVLAEATSPAIEMLQPEKLDENFIIHIQSLQPDFFVVAAYAKIISRRILDIPRLGTLGVHPSLLPKFRGASPIQSTILAGEAETGTTIYLLDEKADHGPIFAQEQLKLDGTLASALPYLILEEKLALLGGKLLVDVIPNFFAGKITPRVQDETQATFTKKFTTEAGFVSAEDLTAAEQGNLKKAHDILLKINALNPEPGVWTIRNEIRTKLLKAEIENNRLRLKETQAAGEKPKKLQ